MYLQRVGRGLTQPRLQASAPAGAKRYAIVYLPKSVFKRCGSFPVLGDVELLSPLAVWASERGALASAYIVGPHAVETCALSVYKALVASWIFNA
jgi:hypothetical protein